MENTILSTPVLEPLFRIAVPARDNRFVPEDHFGAGLQVGNLLMRIVSKLFRDQFMSMAAVPPYAEHELVVCRLACTVSDADLARAVGGRIVAETAVTDIWHVLEHDSEDLVQEQEADYGVFLVRGIDENLYTVKVKVMATGNSCDLLTYPFGENELRAGCRIFLPYAVA